MTHDRKAMKCEGGRCCPMCDRPLVVHQKQMIRRTKDNRLFWIDIYLHDCPGVMPPKEEVQVSA